MILSGGHDAQLLRIRAEVLKSNGIIVVAVFTPDELIKRFREGDFDVVLLCHTFSNEEQSRVARAVHADSPSTPVIVLSNGERMNSAADLVISTDPVSLVNSIRVTVSQRPRLWRKHAS